LQSVSRRLMSATQVMASFCEAVESDMTIMFDAPGA
jgi:hypothetical protein